MKRILQSCLAIGLNLLLNGCAINPVTGEADFVTISESQEIAQGKQYHEAILAQYGVYDDPALQAYINNIGQKLAAQSHRSHLKFHFTVLDSPEINAFALPGGYIYITRGIMAYLNSEAEIAGVLGHEIGHVTARHSVRQQSGQFASGLLNVVVAATTGSQSLGQLSNQLTTGIVRGYGRKHELEADKLGAQYLHKIGYNPESMLEVIGVLKDQEIYEKELAKKQNREPNVYHGVYSTHPKNDKRLKTVIRAAKKLSSKKYKDANAKTYLKMIDGMTWGQNIKQGVIVNNRFMHPDMKIAIQFPADWQVKNSPEALLAQDHASGAIVQMTMMELGKGESLPDLLKRTTKNDDLAVKSHGYGSSALTSISIAKSKQPARVSALKLNDRQSIFVIGTSPEGKFKNIDAELLKINQSFTRLSDKEAGAIDSPVLKIINANNNTSYRDLARNSPISYDAESRLRLLNRAFPTGKISNNQPIKIIDLNE